MIRTVLSILMSLTLVRNWEFIVPVIEQECLQFVPRWNAYLREENFSVEFHKNMLSKSKYGFMYIKYSIYIINSCNSFVLVFSLFLLTLPYLIFLITSFSSLIHFRSVISTFKKKKKKECRLNYLCSKSF